MTTTTIDFSNVNDISKDEIIGLTSIAASFKKKPLYTKIEYTNICFDEFITDTKYNPRPIFSRAADFAEQKIELACEDFFVEESVKRISPNSWQIQCGFLEVDVCAHYSTEYIQDNSEPEDIAVHRAVVSMIVRYDINNMYRYNKYSIDTFKQVNQFYTTLRKVLM